MRMFCYETIASVGKFVMPLGTDFFFSHGMGI